MARYVFNDSPSAPGRQTPSEPRDFHRKLPGYAPTPVVEARATARALGVGRLWVKDESSRLGLPSFKILGASWGTYRALDDRFGPLEPWRDVDELRARLAPHLPLALAAATDGNHGRAVARMARLLGLGARIFVPAGTAPARVEAITLEGATCDVVDGTYDDTVVRAAKEADARCLVISDTSWEGYEDVPRWVIEGYSTIFAEAAGQLEAAPDVVVIQVGVGALAAAAVRFVRAVWPDARLLAVEPARAPCVLASVEAGRIVTVPGPHDSIMAGLNCGTPSPVAWDDVRVGFDCYLAVEDARAEEAMRLVATDGITAGETGAAGIAGLLEAVHGPDGLGLRLGLDASPSVLALCTEGATDPGAYARIVPGAGREGG